MSRGADLPFPSSPDFLHIAPAVDAALAAEEPVVALETTILAFGLPHPLNRDVARDCEAAAAAQGVVPATIAILDGRLRVGLTPEEIEFFCAPNPDIVKVNLQNFAAVLASGRPGALTVAACLQACWLAGIRVFATGGIGGVHRGSATLPDVSGDLPALARFPVATVCAGAKSILDVAATLEWLETLGVPVAGFNTVSFPLFHARESGHPLDITFTEIAALGNFAKTHFALGARAGGILVVTPVPADAAIAPEELNVWIDEAVARAKQKNVRGKAVTPFLLHELESLSNGRTLIANRALVVNNVTLAARLATTLASPPTPSNLNPTL